ncbi:MAG: Ig-like domain-containing protein, partial [Thermoleophilia bacterium]|nr:Ig-like domain-containing protein [Thermoleophilia bacterium]
VAVGTDTATPYTFTWNADAAAAGAHQLTLIALDAAGNASTAARTVAVRDTSAPTVAFTSPAASASVTGTVSVGVTASDDVAVAQVLLQVDGVDVATDLAAPWSFSWNTSTLWLGVHTLRIVASDGTGNSSFATRTVTVATTSVPFVSLSGDPAAEQGRALHIRVDAASDVGISRIDVSVDGAAIGTGTASPYLLDWIAVGIGQHTVTTLVTDTAGQTSSTSRVRTVTMPSIAPDAIFGSSPPDDTGGTDTNETPPPTIRDHAKPALLVTGTRSGRTITEATFTLRVIARDATGVTRVELWINGHRTRVTRAAAARFVLARRLLRAGRNTVVIKVFDPAGNVATKTLVLRR